MRVRITGKVVSCIYLYHSLQRDKNVDQGSRSNSKTRGAVTDAKGQYGKGHGTLLIGQVQRPRGPVKCVLQRGV